VGAGEVEFFAQEVDEQGARLDRLLFVLAVDADVDEFLGHGVSPCVQAQRAQALAMARLTIWPAIAVLYSASPRRSSAGSQMAMAASAAACIGGGRERLAQQRGFGGFGAQRGGRHVGQRDAHVADRAAGLAHARPRAGRGPVAGLALELFVGPAGALGEGRHADLDQDLVSSSSVM
jgi:hypothetical protein